MVNRGLRKRVGDGANVRVWTDRWIPNTQTELLISPRGNADEDLRVSEFIRADLVGWNVELLDMFLLPFERDRVLSIPLSTRRPRDSWYWSLEKKGEYSVRSAYRAIFGEDEGELRADCSETKVGLWGKIWHANTIPRVKLFFWRACLEALPTRASLHKRIESMDSLCGICGAEEETVIHALGGCIFARLVWEQRRVCEEVDGVFRSFREMVECCFEKLRADDRALLMNLCWVIWGVVTNGLWRGKDLMRGEGWSTRNNCYEIWGMEGVGASQLVCRGEREVEMWEVWVGPNRLGVW